MTWKLRPGRAALCVGLFAVLAGPTPGAVGSCGGDELDRPADFESYCLERGQLVCVRRGLRREIPLVEEHACRREAIAFCESVSDWSPRCRPTERVTSACLTALRSLDTLETPESEIEECRSEALCSAAPMPPDGGAGL
jgi:hypothetical protein